MIYVSQVIMLYTLIIYRAVYQLYLNKIEKKKKTHFIATKKGYVIFLYWPKSTWFYKVGCISPLLDETESREVRTQVWNQFMWFQIPAFPKHWHFQWRDVKGHTFHILASLTKQISSFNALGEVLKGKKDLVFPSFSFFLPAIHSPDSVKYTLLE